MCVGSDNMAFPMSGLANSSAEISSSLGFTQVRYTQVREAWTEEPQLDLIAGLSIPWTGPTKASLPQVSATCWMFGRELNRKTKVPVGLIGVHVNKTDIWPWAPYEATVSPCARESFYNHSEARGYWGGMVYPLLNMTAAGAIFSEGQLDAERNTNMSEYQCLLNQTLNTWVSMQKLDKERDSSQIISK